MASIVTEWIEAFWGKQMARSYFLLTSRKHYFKKKCNSLFWEKSIKISFMLNTVLQTCSQIRNYHVSYRDGAYITLFHLTSFLRNSVSAFVWCWFSLRWSCLPFVSSANALYRLEYNQLNHFKYILITSKHVLIKHASTSNDDCDHWIQILLPS